MDSITGVAADSVSGDAFERDVSEKVVAEVAQAAGVDVLDLDPLYDVVDPDALDRIVDSAGAAASLELSFEMAGCDVVVGGDGEVAVSAPSDGPVTLGRAEE